jgi:hypothetical protein
MSTRARYCRGMAVLGLGLLILPTRAQTPDGDATKPRQRDEARLNVELLELEFNMEKMQLHQELQELKQSEFVAVGIVGPGGGSPDAEASKKAAEEARGRYEKLKAATLATGRKLADERRRLAELEGRPGDEDGRGDRTGPGAKDRDGGGSGRRRRGGFIKAGKNILSLRRIDSTVQTDNGLVRIEMSGGKTVVLGGQAAKAFLEAMAAECR